VLSGLPLLASHVLYTNGTAWNGLILSMPQIIFLKSLSNSQLSFSFSVPLSYSVSAAACVSMYMRVVLRVYQPVCVCVAMCSNA